MQVSRACHLVTACCLNQSFELCELMCSMQPTRGNQSKYLYVDRVYLESDVKIKEKTDKVQKSQ